MNDLAAEITRDNALELLRDQQCPCCGVRGDYMLFNEINNNGIGIKCTACEQHHPFIKQRIMWLRGGPKPRRSQDIVAVAKECGAYCYICGLTFDELERLGIGLNVHHTRRYADHGETYRKIPVCTECHEIATLMQRIHKRAIERAP